MTGLDLPQGYFVEKSADTQDLIAPNGKLVSSFTPSAASVEIERAAYKDAYEVQRAFAELQRLLAQQRDARRGHTYPAAFLSGAPS